MQILVVLLFFSIAAISRFTGVNNVITQTSVYCISIMYNWFTAPSRNMYKPKKDSVLVQILISSFLYLETLNMSFKYVSDFKPCWLLSFVEICSLLVWVESVYISFYVWCHISTLTKNLHMLSFWSPAGSGWDHMVTCSLTTTNKCYRISLLVTKAVCTRLWVLWQWHKIRKGSEAVAQRGREKPWEKYLSCWNSQERQGSRERDCDQDRLYTM